MKKLIVFASMLCIALAGFAQEEVKPRIKGEMKFEETRHNFGVFAQDTAIVSHDFIFTNVGKAPLIIHQASASCGCTVPTFTKEPVKSGEKGEINVTYNGKGLMTGRFSKTITVRSNAKNKIVRLIIEGEMTE